MIELGRQCLFLGFVLGLELPDLGFPIVQAFAAGNIGGSISGQDYNKDIYIPLSTLRTRIGDRVATNRSGTREFEVVELSPEYVEWCRTKNAQPVADLENAVGMTPELVPFLDVMTERRRQRRRRSST